MQRQLEFACLKYCSHNGQETSKDFLQVVQLSKHVQVRLFVCAERITCAVRWCTGAFKSAELSARWTLVVVLLTSCQAVLTEWPSFGGRLATHEQRSVSHITFHSFCPVHGPVFGSVLPDSSVICGPATHLHVTGFVSRSWLECLRVSVHTEVVSATNFCWARGMKFNW